MPQGAHLQDLASPSERGQCHYLAFEVFPKKEMKVWSKFFSLAHVHRLPLMIDCIIFRLNEGTEKFNETAFI